MNALDCTHSKNLSVGFLGAGNMAFALASGIIKSGLVQADKVWASAPTDTNLKKFKALGCHSTHLNYVVVQQADIVFLCVKPYKISEVLGALNYEEPWKPNQIIVSVAAGITLKFLESLLPPACHIIRAMPNTPAMVQAGVIVYARGTRATSEDGVLVAQLLKSLSICEEIPESMIDVVCGLSGSGPAYVYTIIQAMADGAVKMGLPRSLASKFAAQTVMGAAKMVLETGKHPDVLKDEVCSPGGTTIYGVHALENGGVRAALMDAIQAATTRANELGKL